MKKDLLKLSKVVAMLLVIITFMSVWNINASASTTIRTYSVGTYTCKDVATIESTVYLYNTKKLTTPYYYNASTGTTQTKTVSYSCTTGVTSSIDLSVKLGLSEYGYEVSGTYTTSLALQSQHTGQNAVSITLNSQSKTGYYTFVSRVKYKKVQITMMKKTLGASTWSTSAQFKIARYSAPQVYEEWLYTASYPTALLN